MRRRHGDAPIDALEGTGAKRARLWKGTMISGAKGGGGDAALPGAARGVEGARWGALWNPRRAAARAGRETAKLRGRTRTGRRK